MIVEASTREQVEEFINAENSSQCFYQWPLNYWQSLFVASGSCGEGHRIYHLKKDGELIAWCVFFFEKSSLSAHLLKIYCCQHWRGQGHARYLLEKAFLKLSQAGVGTCFLEVSAENTAALELYKKMGFEVYHCSRKYYSDGSDAVKMEISIAPSH